MQLELGDQYYLCTFYFIFLNRYYFYIFSLFLLLTFNYFVFVKLIYSFNLFFVNLVINNK